jgi:transformation/transcription domain-associated protein
MALKPDVWPNCELKLAWFDRLFQTVDTQATQVTPISGVVASNQPNFTNICTALELLTFLLSILRKDQILTGFKPLQRGLATLMNCANPKVLNLILFKLCSIIYFEMKLIFFISDFK